MQLNLKPESAQILTVMT